VYVCVCNLVVYVSVCNLVVYVSVCNLVVYGYVCNLIVYIGVCNLVVYVSVCNLAVYVFVCNLVVYVCVCNLVVRVDLNEYTWPDMLVTVYLIFHVRGSLDGCVVYTLAPFMPGDLVSQFDHLRLACTANSSLQSVLTVYAKYMSLTLITQISMIMHVSVILKSIRYLSIQEHYTYHL
jgi:hypothetical protein